MTHVDPAIQRPSLSRAELLRRARLARASLGSCQLCERRCGVDRLAGEAAPCGLDHRTFCFKRHVSFAEELRLLPSYMAYLAACNLRCRFCVQGPTCFDPHAGTEVDPQEAAADFADIVRRGARTINPLGGEPSLHLHTILEIAAAAESPLPLVLNTNMYMTPEVIELLDGVVELYVADFKFGNDACARRLAGIDRYTEVVTRNLLLAAPRAELLVRHLVMPGHVECCLRPVAQWLALNLPEVAVTVMLGYVPAWRADGDPALGRCISDSERIAAEQLVRECGLRRST